MQCNLSEMLLYLILLICYTDVISSQDVSELCRNYFPFSDPRNRSIYNNETFELDDRYIREDWYGIRYYVIPSDPPGRSHCGTVYPIYLRSAPSRPQVLENIDACVVIRGNCDESFKIPTIQCSNSLTIYKLKKPPLNEAAYCLAPGSSGLPPEFSTQPEITYKLRRIDDFEEEYEFTCEFPKPNQANLVYQTDWLVDDVSVYISEFTAYEDINNIRKLTDTKLRAAGITTVGFQVHCKLYAGFDNIANPPVSEPSTSPKLFVGIYVSDVQSIPKDKDLVITIEEGKNKRIFLRPSLPIGCSTPKNEKNCKFAVTADIPPQVGNEKCQPTVTANGGCGVEIETKTWNTYIPFTIEATTTAQYDVAEFGRKIFFRSNDRYSSHPIWQKYQLSPVSIQVQVYQCTRSDTGYCVCGVVVRVGRTAFMINHCDIGYWFVDYIACGDGGDILNVKTLSKSHYEIILPSGTKVNMHLMSSSSAKWLKIYIYPSVRDAGKTSGMCGELTDTPWTRPSNLPQFFEQFRILQNDDLFDDSNRNNILGSDLKYSKFQHCSCNETAVNDGIYDTATCSDLPPTQFCTLQKYTLFHQKRCRSLLRQKRSIPQYNPLLERGNIRQKRDVSWKNGWTAERANTYCNELFGNSTVVDRCKDIEGIDVNGIIETCVSDIQLSGTDFFALAAVTVVSSTCLNEASMNQTLREEKVEGTKSVLELVEEVACPGQCSDQGICEQGQCTCNEGYIGDDCSVQFNKPPLAHNLEADGHCDLQLDECTETAVFGGEFVDDQLTKCKLVPFKIDKNKIINDETVKINPAIFESIGEVTCKLPQDTNRKKRSVDIPSIDETVTGYRVSVSNNGEDFSEQLTLLVYNSLCTNCTMDDSDNIQCLFLDNYCIMANNCYKNGSVLNTGGSEFVCIASADRKLWYNPVTNETYENVETGNGGVTTDRNGEAGVSTTESNGIAETGSTTTDTSSSGEKGREGGGPEEENDTVINIIVVVCVVVFIIVAVVVGVIAWKKSTRGKRATTPTPFHNPTYVEDEQNVNPYETVTGDQNEGHQYDNRRDFDAQHNIYSKPDNPSQQHVYESMTSK